MGEYTSAAIASIACGERAAVVDGNVIRVLARLRRLGGDPRSGAMGKQMAALAAALVDDQRPGDFNQVGPEGWWGLGLKGGVGWGKAVAEGRE